MCTQNSLKEPCYSNGVCCSPCFPLSAEMPLRRVQVMQSWPQCRAGEGTFAPDPTSRAAPLPPAQLHPETVSCGAGERGLAGE